MSAEAISTDGSPKPGGAYSQAMRLGDVVAVAGQVGIDPATLSTLEGVEAQTRQALMNLEAILVAAGGSLQSLVKTTCFLASMEDFAAFNSAYAAVMGDHLPARSTVGVGLVSGFLVEIEGIAVIPT